MISYGVYLWHLPLLLVLRHTGMLPEPLAPRMVVVLTVALAAGAASWYLVERPSIERAKRGRATTAVARRKDARSPSEAAARA